MRLIIKNDPQEVAACVAHHIVDRIKAFAPSSTHRFTLGLSTGSRLLPIYDHLIKSYLAGEVTFKHVVTFNVGEYVGLPQSHPQSTHTFMHDNFFSRVDISSSNINILNGNAPNLLAECSLYEARIASSGGIELLLTEMGMDGQIAFNEPGSSMVSRTRVKPLASEKVVANAKLLMQEPTRPLKFALTVGLETVMDAHEVILVATGEKKAVAIQSCVEGGVTHLSPASCLQNHRCAMIAVDEVATRDLKESTVKRFKDLEKAVDSLSPDEQRHFSSHSTRQIDRSTTGGHRAQKATDTTWDMEEYLESW